ncbi:MAG: T9SS type A sorting domain-containing protein [Flavobacteriales bacterium]|nr:T9SS type A sorting domain-containing protein [Flavobacteriales bacterium]MCB9364485.1 T9SS type A sorting domain-containing protein [Flavobacteriales bacterium]
MKKTLLLLLSTILITSLKSQQVGVMDFNDVRARIGSNYLFQDPDLGMPGYEIPKGSGSHTFYAAALWLAGKDQGTIKSNANTYYNAGQPIAGPIMNSNLYSTEGASWDKIWSIECSEIAEFVSWYNCSQDPGCNENVFYPGYQIPQIIINWPGNGDVSKGQAAKLAPFYDRNNDGIYNPTTDGDYPLIKGDAAIFFMYNDERPVFAGTSTRSPMKTEVHGMVYTFVTNDIINQTVFLDYKVYNRSTTNYTDCYIGFWADFDLGKYDDDYIGSDVDRNSFYVYNGDNNDEGGSGVVGYGSNLPAQSVTILKGPKLDDDGTDNAIGVGTNESVNGIGFDDGIDDNEYWGLEHFMYYNSGSGNQGDPSTDQDFYNYLSGKWLNGSSLTYGGTGFGGTTPSKYAYPANSDTYSYGTGGLPQSNWSEVGLANFPDDRKGVGSSGPFTLPAGESTEIEMALVFGQDMTGSGNLAGVAVMQENIDFIKNFYTNSNEIPYCLGNSNPTGIESQQPKNSNNLYTFPNPVSNEINIKYNSKSANSYIEIHNTLGEKLYSQKLTQLITTINTVDYAKGIYLITIFDEGQKTSAKVIKQ